MFKRLRDISFWQSLQTAGISLLLIMALSPYPSRFSSYVLGVCCGFALIYRLLLPSQKGTNFYFRYALPYLVLYGVLLGSCFFSDHISSSLSYCGRYFCLCLIPLIFVGMTPSFFTERRLRIFAFCLVAGAVIGVLWKAIALYQVYFVNRLDVYREQGFWICIRTGYESFMYFLEGLPYELEHPAFEALFELMALVVILQAWIKRDVIFSHGYAKILAVFAIGIIMINLLLFCTKMAALGCVASVFALWVYALCKKRYVFVVTSAVGVLLCIGGLTLHSPELFLSRFNRTIHTTEDFLKGKDTRADSSFIPRIHAYKVGWEMFKEKPVTGWGIFYTKEFGERHKRYYGNVLARPHNQLLDILDSCGIAGGVAFIWLLACVLRDVWRKKSLFWWIWFAGLLAICMIDMLFNHTVGLIYLCGFHGVLKSFLWH